jgi:hypothetical protein
VRLDARVAYEVSQCGDQPISVRGHEVDASAVREEYPGLVLLLSILDVAALHPRHHLQVENEKVAAGVRLVLVRVPTSQLSSFTRRFCLFLPNFVELRTGEVHAEGL